ncbi:MAG TPA: AMP-binding protein, partial [Candidatus Methylomirabilis sp.]|nr:AMP-binding protein [Candidatus Methylomirabilis sp.]
MMAATANPLGRDKPGSVGIPMPDVEVRVVDSSGRQVPAGEVGEVLLRAPQLMLRYWNRPKETAEAIRDGWLHTGDLGYLDRDGFLFVLGREKSLLIGHDGEKYSPEGIEETVVDRSRFIDQIMLHNNQSPATVALLVPNREALAEWMERHGMAPDRVEGQDAALRLLEAEIDAYKAGGRHAGMFPERWLPSTFAVLDEGFTEQNRMLNSTMKMVRGRIEEQYRDRIAQLHRADGAQVTSAANREAIRRVLA